MEENAGKFYAVVVIFFSFVRIHPQWKVENRIEDSAPVIAVTKLFKMLQPTYHLHVQRILSLLGKISQ